MKPIAIFYHTLFVMDSPDNLLESAVDVVQHQMDEIVKSGLLDAATEFHVGINGGSESGQMANILIPSKAKIVLHGLQCHNENRTIRMLEKWLPEHNDWYVFYFHAKGSTSPPHKHQMNTLWRECMMKHTIQNWRRCVSDLDSGFEAVGCHWMEPPHTPAGQYIFAGTFFWAKASFLLTLPSIMDRDRIKVSGIDSADSRYESEVWLGNGPRPPKVKDYHGPLWNPSKYGTCPG
jgi:hypothetical protein